MVNSEKNMTNLKDAKTRNTVGDSRTLPGENMAIGTSSRDMTENYIV